MPCTAPMPHRCASGLSLAFICFALLLCPFPACNFFHPSSLRCFADTLHERSPCLVKYNNHFIEGNTEAQRNYGQKVHPQVLKCINVLQHLGTRGVTCSLEMVPLRVCRSRWFLREQRLLSNFEMKATYFDV